MSNAFKNINRMNEINNKTAYESPETRIVNISAEGVLCGSLDMTHDGFEDGGSISFGDAFDE